MFKKIFDQYLWEQVSARIYNSTENEFHNALQSESKNVDNLYALFSPHADNYIEQLASKAQAVTRQRFGNIIQLYTPLYISNECTNSCLYCGFNYHNSIKRTTLSIEQIMDETRIIYDMGFRHILLLTGEDKRSVSVEKLAEIAGRIHKKFASVSIEVYPMETEEYKKLVNAGIDGLTIYQETYNKACYKKVHPTGKKRDFYWRLAGPDRGGQAGLRKIGIGALLGLSDWRVEGFFTALHALYLSNTYWKSHITISFPRLREHSGDFTPDVTVSDKNLTHLICALRCILPDSGLALSTRESQYLRDNLLPLGITMMSAGSKTEPGGYSNLQVADEQFSINDNRSPDEIASMIQQHGFDPVWKDWDRDFLYK